MTLSVRVKKMSVETEADVSRWVGDTGGGFGFERTSS